MGDLEKLCLRNRNYDASSRIANFFETLHHGTVSANKLQRHQSKMYSLLLRLVSMKAYSKDTSSQPSM